MNPAKTVVWVKRIETNNKSKHRSVEFEQEASRPISLPVLDAPKQINRRKKPTIRKQTEAGRRLSNESKKLQFSAHGVSNM
jgi:hypothetical protein